MSKPQFTFKNYLKEIKKCWILLAIFFVLGGAAGAYYSFTKPTSYTANAKFSVYNSKLNTGSTTSPYSQIGELIMSDQLIGGELSEYTVVEKPFGVFTITSTASDSQKAVDTANSVVDNTSNAISAAFEDADEYKITILSRATDASQTVTNKHRIISAAVIALGSLALALVIIFIKFDYTAEK